MKKMATHYCCKGSMCGARSPMGCGRRMMFAATPAYFSPCLFSSVCSSSYTTMTYEKNAFSPIRAAVSGPIRVMRAIYSDQRQHQSDSMYNDYDDSDRRGFSSDKEGGNMRRRPGRRLSENDQYSDMNGGMRSRGRSKRESWGRSNYNNNYYNNNKYNNNYREFDRTTGSRSRNERSLSIKGEAVYGLASVRAALMCQKRNAYHVLYVQEGLCSMNLDDILNNTKPKKLRNSGIDGENEEFGDTVYDFDQQPGPTYQHRKREKLKSSSSSKEINEIIHAASKLYVLKSRGSKISDGPGTEEENDFDRHVDDYATSMQIEGQSGQLNEVSSSIDVESQYGDGISLRLVETSKHSLNQISNNRPHQGLVLDCSPLLPTQVDALTCNKSQGKFFLALDEVQDPQNLGALIRSAYFLGVDGVIMCGKNSSPLSPVVAKASAGALDHMYGSIYSIRSMPRFLNNCMKDGWDVVGTAGNAEDATEISQFVPKENTILVLGNEGQGLRYLVSKACSRHVMIAPHGDINVQSSIDSLNVSVAGAILMHALKSCLPRV